MRNKGNFISFEGVAGAGKSTQIHILFNQLEKMGRSCFITKAFEGNRRKATEDYFSGLAPYTNDNAITFIFQALHCIQAEEVRSVRDQNDFVLADRWRETFFSYHQLYGPLSRMPPIVLEKMDELAFGDLHPDITLFFDVSPEIAYQRYQDREQNKGKMIASQEISFFENTVGFYRELAEKRDWVRINADLSPEAVNAQIRNALELNT